MSDYQEYTVKVYANGNKFWYQDDKRHRVDGPAIEYADGSKYWYQNDKRHRSDGPACEYDNGEKHWYQDGKLHRVDGPAIECVNGYKEWWIDGKQLTEEKFNNRNNSCDGKMVEIDGKKYKLTEI